MACTSRSCAFGYHPFLVPTAFFGAGVKHACERYKTSNSLLAGNSRAVVRSASKGPQSSFKPDGTGSTDSKSEYEEDEGEVTDLSRRVFTVGVAVVGFATAVEGFHLFATDEAKQLASRPFRRAFPAFFAADGDSAPPATRRAAMDGEFADLFLSQHANVALAMGLLSSRELQSEESGVMARARPLFFPRDKSAPADGNAERVAQEYNYRLYARVHAIAQHTSPQSRMEFSRRLGAECYRFLNARCAESGHPLVATRRARQNGRLYSEDWLMAVNTVLVALVGLGWISSFRISDFDNGPGSSWLEEGRGELTVYCDDPVTLSTAMLLGEEEFEEISPKISSIVAAVMADYGVSNISFEDYYMDVFYRSDPAAFQPRQLATQFNISTQT